MRSEASNRIKHMYLEGALERWWAMRGLKNGEKEMTMENEREFSRDERKEVLTKELTKVKQNKLLITQC